MKRSKLAGKSFEEFATENECSAAERAACLELLAFLRFRSLLRSPEVLRLLATLLAVDPLVSLALPLAGEEEAS